MPNCDFYAMGLDHLVVLDFLLSKGDCDIYENTSKPGRETMCFRTLDDFKNCFDFENWDQIPVSMYLALHAREAGGTIQQRRFELNNPTSALTGFRYSTEGWRLIQLNLRKPHRGTLSASHTNHNSQARALTWRDTADEMGEPDSWDWRIVNSFSRKLNGFIRKQAVAKQGSRVVLPSAHEAHLAGLSLSRN